MEVCCHGSLLSWSNFVVGWKRCKATFRWKRCAKQLCKATFQHTTDSTSRVDTQSHTSSLSTSSLVIVACVEFVEWMELSQCSKYSKPNERQCNCASSYSRTCASSYSRTVLAATPVVSTSPHRQHGLVPTTTTNPHNARVHSTAARIMFKMWTLSTTSRRIY